MRRKKSRFYDYLWIWTIVYFVLGMFNILFAWLGIIDFLLPLIIAIIWGNKFFCNSLCGRGQLFTVIGKQLRCSTGSPTPKWMLSKQFRYGFMIFFLVMFSNVVFQTWLVASEANTVKEAVILLFSITMPWEWAYTGGIVPSWMAQFSFGLYGLMLVSLIIGLIVMILFRPRTWCSFCPMGTMTQEICKMKNHSCK